MIDAVIFDIGGVLLDWNPRYLYRKLFDDEEAMERFLREVCTLEWHAQHDLGVSPAQSCAVLAEAHPDQAELIWAWTRRSEEMVSGPVAGTIEILVELKAAGYRCYALTNMEADTYPLRVARYEFFNLFDGTVVSAYEGIAKPDAAIFTLLVERFGLVASTTLLVDDNPANIASAAGIGMQTELFGSASELRRRLVREALLS